MSRFQAVYNRYGSQLDTGVVVIVIVVAAFGPFPFLPMLVLMGLYLLMHVFLGLLTSLSIPKRHRPHILHHLLAPTTTFLAIMCFVPWFLVADEGECEKLAKSLWP